MRPDPKAKKVKHRSFGGDNAALRSNRRKAKQDPENAPRPVGMKQLHRKPGDWGSNLKNSYPDMSYFVRWLEQQVGRHWDDIFSDVCKKGDEARDHVEWYVTTDIREIDGELYEVGYDGKPRELVAWGRWDLYVDPRDGILKKKPAREKIRREKKTNYIKHPTDPLIQYHWINGCLFEVTLQEIKKYSGGSGYVVQNGLSRFVYCEKYTNRYDCVTKTHGRSMYELRRDYGGDLIPVSKRQLNSREVKRIKKAA